MVKLCPLLVKKSLLCTTCLRKRKFLYQQWLVLRLVVAVIGRKEEALLRRALLRKRVVLNSTKYRYTRLLSKVHIAQEMSLCLRPQRPKWVEITKSVKKLFSRVIALAAVHKVIKVVYLSLGGYLYVMVVVLLYCSGYWWYSICSLIIWLGGS